MLVALLFATALGGASFGEVKGASDCFSGCAPEDAAASDGISEVDMASQGTKAR